MSSHLRANLWLLLFTVALCSVLYPLMLLGIGQTFFQTAAEGSLVRDGQGKVIGSRLIAQPFNGDEYFQPRPSAVGYKADASGASNWGANNPLLRDRVARQLGPLVRYSAGPRKGEPVGPDVEKWFADKTAREPGWLTDWAASHSAVVANWAKSDDLLKDYIVGWARNHPEVLGEWRKSHPDSNEAPKAENVAVPFVASYARAHPGTWPTVVEQTTDGIKEKKVQPVKEGSDLQAAFFDAWLQEHSDAPLEEVPADMVTASGSGLDPHITLTNARYQLKYRVAAAQAQKCKLPEDRVREVLERVLNEAAVRPLGGLAGVEMVNVLDVNLSVMKEMDKLASQAR